MHMEARPVSPKLVERAASPRREGLRGRRGRAAALLPAGVVEGLEGPEVPPRRGEAVLQELAAALARRLEQLDVTS